MAVYGKFVEHVMTPALSGITVKGMLVTTSYVQDTAHEFRDDITAWELVATGYTAGGLDAGAFLDVELSEFRVNLGGGSIYFGLIDVTDLGGIVFYEDTGLASTDRLIAADLFGSVEVTGIVEYYYGANEAGIMTAGFDDDEGA